MLLKIALDINGQEQTFQKRVMARDCRLALEAWEKYGKEAKKTNGVPNDETIGKAVDWLVEAFDGRFTAEQFWSGYSGSFLELPVMMNSIIVALSSEVLAFPKPETPDAK